MDSLKGTLTPIKVLNGTLNGGIAYGTFNYNELENKPSVNGTELVGNVNIAIPTKTSDLTNDSGFITDADVPTKTSDLTNDSGFITDADVPTKTSELRNDSGFITSQDIPTIPTATSQLNNDSGFLTMNTTPVRSVNSQTGDVNLFIPNATSQLTNDAGFITESSQKITDMEDDIEANAEAISVRDTIESVSISTSGAIANVYQSNASKQNKLVIVNLNLSLTSNTSLYSLLCTLTKKPVSDMQFFLHSSTNNLMYECKIFANTGKIQWWNTNNIASGSIIGGQLIYFTND